MFELFMWSAIAACVAVLIWIVVDIAIEVNSIMNQLEEMDNE